MITRIDFKDSLIHAMKKGLNLFIGAGFPIKAYDNVGRRMPDGATLLKELHQTLGSGINDLPKYCSVMERKNRAALYDYLTKRFHVARFDDFYNNLNLINLKGVYTTNIDDLIPQIIANSPNRYVHEQSVNGDCTDSRGVNYLPLHGYVKYPEQGYVFSIEKIANIYNQAPKIWAYLSAAIERYPTLFMGYDFNDTGVIDTILAQPTFSNSKKSMWIILYKPTLEIVQYYEDLDFNIIISDTEEFLKEIPLMSDWSKVNQHRQTSLEKLLQKNVIPKDDRGMTQRSIDEFYRGMAPEWPDILRNVIPRVSFYKEVENSVHGKMKHTIIVGAPITGKTTLAMQIGHLIDFDGTKLMFNNLNMGRAEYIFKLIGNSKALLIVENFTDDVEAFLLLTKLPNVKLLGVDRGHNFTIVNHKVNPKDFDVINVTELKEQDIQSIIDAIPEGIRRSEAEIKKNKFDANDSIFEFVIRHVKGQTIRNRYRDFIQKLEKTDRDLTEFLVLCAYMNKARVPLSMEVAYSYFSDKTYDEVIAMRKQLADFLQEDDNEWLAENEIDGYRPRTSIISDAILEYTKRDTLADVMWKVINNVYYVSICNYRTFHKWAFDKDMMMRAFPNWHEGKEFLEEAFLYDNRNPYVLQQGALYLSAKKRYREAFDWIDRAKTMTDDKHFSIRNSHAIILFDANYEVDTEEAKIQLDRSMDILHKCYTDDKRRTFHARTYAEQSLQYFKKYHNDKAARYLEQAQAWLKDELITNSWAYDLKSLLSRIDDTLKHQQA